MNFRRLYDFLKSPRREYRSRGFGIHSPFAFRFVREVLKQPCAYYAYSSLDALARKEGVDSCVVRAIFRIALAVRPGRLEVRAPESYAIETALRLGSAGESETPLKAVAGLYGEASRVAEEWAGSNRGMLFVAPEMAVFIISDNLPKQRFDVAIS